MNYETLLAEVRQGKLRSIYLLYGEETYLAQQVARAIIDAAVPAELRDLNVTVHDRDPQIDNLIGQIEAVPFLGGTNVILIRDTRLFRAVSPEPAGHSQDHGRLVKLFSNMPDYSHVIFMTSHKVEKRSTLYKAVEQYGAAVELAPFTLREARIWLKDRLNRMQKKITPEANRQLLAAVSLMPKISLSFLDSELTKLDLYTKNEREITEGHLAASLAGVPELSVFAAIEAASQKQTDKALTLLAAQLGAGESPLKISGLLARQVRLLWQTKDLVQSGITDSRALAKRLGLHPFVAEKLLEQSRKFTVTKLKQVMLNIAAFDRDFKSGKASKTMLEQLVIELCQ